MYKLGIKDKTYFKEKFFCFLKLLKNVDNVVDEFWTKNIKKIAPWYLEHQKKTDIIISASPTFLLEYVEKKYEIHVIASIVDKKTGKFLSKNCFGEEKVKRFTEIYGDKRINQFYTDSKSDLPMVNLAANSFLVDYKKGIKITAFNKYLEGTNDDVKNQ